MIKTTGYPSTSGMCFTQDVNKTEYKLSPKTDRFKTEFGRREKAEWEEKYTDFSYYFSSLPLKQFLCLRTKIAFMNVFDSVPEQHPKKWTYANNSFCPILSDDVVPSTHYKPFVLISYCGDFQSLLKIDKLVGDAIYNSEYLQNKSLLHFLIDGIEGIEEGAPSFPGNLDFLSCAKFFLKKNPSMHLEENSDGMLPIECALHCLEKMEISSKAHSENLSWRISKLEDLISHLKVQAEKVTVMSKPQVKLQQFNKSTVNAIVAKSEAKTTETPKSILTKSKENYLVHKLLKMNWAASEDEDLSS